LADKAHIPLWFESEVGKGSVFNFRLPSSKDKSVKQGKKQDNLIGQKKGI
jgi:hypothetical protein